MQKFKWDSHLETGNELIDLEHRQIIQIYNDCVELVQGGTGTGILIEKLHELQAKIAAHFKTEEILAGCIPASDAGKVKLAQHKEMHDDMLGFLDSSIAKLTELDDNTVAAQELFDHVYAWYGTHIENEDKDFVTHVKRRFAS